MRKLSVKNVILALGVLVGWVGVSVYHAKHKALDQIEVLGTPTQVSAPEKKDTLKHAEPELPPIDILESPRPQPKLAFIDRKTLKVTYNKGADPKAVVDEMVKAWIQVTGQLQQCNQAYQELQAKNK